MRKSSVYIRDDVFVRPYYNAMTFELTDSEFAKNPTLLLYDNLLRTAYYASEGKFMFFLYVSQEMIQEILLDAKLIQKKFRKY